MKPIFHPYVVNSPYEDPLVYVDFLFEKRALLFDLGDLHALAPRKILRLSQIFISHTHMDHFIGFDYLLRICLGRDKTIELFGPAGLIDQVEHKLAAYTWNLVENYDTDFGIIAYEFAAQGPLQAARFRCKTRFTREPLAPRAVQAGVVYEDETLRVRATHLDHRIPSLAYALEEKQHINVWKNRLEQRGYPIGPWLKELKSAVMRGEPADHEFRIWWRAEGKVQERYAPLGELSQDLLHIVPGQKIAYVVDCIYHADNAQRIIALARDADMFFVEAVFLQVDAERAIRTHHLTAHQAGMLARQAGVKRVIPLHFSARYSDCPDKIYAEINAAYTASQRDTQRTSGCNTST